MNTAVRSTAIMQSESVTKGTAFFVLSLGVYF